MSTYSTTVLTDNPQAYYRLNDSAGSTAADASGHGYNATLSGTFILSQPGAIAGDSDHAIYFDGLTGQISIPRQLNYTTFSSFTLEFWCNASGNWQHIVVTAQGATTTVYLNGVTYASGVTAQIEISQIFDWAGSYASCSFDEIAIYNTTLSSARVLAHYQAAQGASASSSTYAVYIGGNLVFIIAGSLQIDSSVGRRSQASFIVHSTTATHYQQYQQVSIYDNNANLVFTGYITNPQEQKPGFQNSLLHTIQCCDQHYLADKRLIITSYANKSVGFMAQDIVNNILSAEGVTIGQLDDGITPSTTLYPATTLYPGGNVGLVPAANFVYATVAQAMDELVKLASSAGIPYYWMIDQNKKFYFVPYTAITNNTLVDGTQIEHVNNPPAVSRQNPMYRNTQYITGGVQQTVQQTESRKGDSNTQAWTMGYALALAPTITVNGTGKAVGIKQVNTGKDFYWAQGDPIITQDSGATKLTSSDTLQVVYYGQYPTVIVSSNAAQQSYQASIDGSSGIIEEVETDTTLSDISTGLLEAGSLLTRYAVQCTQLVFTTRIAGFAPGQLITVNLSAFNLNSVQMLIETVSATDAVDGINIWYSVTAILGPYDTTWVSFFSSLLKNVQMANSINIGVSQTANILANFTGTLSPTATLNVTTATCPLPGTSQNPSSSLFPC